MRIKPGPNATEENMYYIPDDSEEENSDANTANLDNNEKALNNLGDSGKTSLYFLDADNNQRLVMRDVNEDNVLIAVDLDLEDRKPGYKSQYKRVWYDEFFRYWIDFGSHTEFYIMQDENRVRNLVKDDLKRKRCLRCAVKQKEALLKKERAKNGI